MWCAHVWYYLVWLRVTCFQAISFCVTKMFIFHLHFICTLWFIPPASTSFRSLARWGQSFTGKGEGPWLRGQWNMVEEYGRATEQFATFPLVLWAFVFINKLLPVFVNPKLPAVTSSLLFQWPPLCPELATRLATKTCRGKRGVGAFLSCFCFAKWGHGAKVFEHP